MVSNTTELDLVTNEDGCVMASVVLVKHYLKLKIN